MELSKKIDKILLVRRSIRNFTNKILTLTELSKLLFYSYGITCQYEIIESQTNEKIKYFFRTAPSAGALYPINFYVMILKVKNLKKGLYHYNAKNHSLEFIRSVSSNEIFDCLVDSGEIDLENICLVIILSANFWRTKAKYGERGYRYVLQESGHIAQNISLVSVALNLGSLCVGGFYDDELNKLLKIDGVDESAIYMILVGKPHKDSFRNIQKLSCGSLRGKKVFDND